MVARRAAEVRADVHHDRGLGLRERAATRTALGGGARRSRVAPFVFQPIKRRPRDAWRGALDAFDVLPSDPSDDVPELAHVHERPDDRPYDSYWLGRGDERRHVETIRDLARAWRALPPQAPWRYENAFGREIRKPGHRRVRAVGEVPVVKGNPQLFHPTTGWPLTPRERARLMGWPDDFKLTDGRAVDRTLRYKLATLTGRGVPSEFARYLIAQMVAHVTTARSAIS